MSLPNQIIVSGAGIERINGTYTKSEDNSGWSIWIHNNDLSNYPDQAVIRFIDLGSESIFQIWIGFPATFNSDVFYRATNYNDVSFSDFLQTTNLTTVYENAAPAPTVTAAPEGGGGGGGSSSPAVKIENANVKFFGKTKFVV